MSVFDRLEAFKAGGEKALVLRDTTPADRNAAHKWVEDNADEAVRGWVHESRSVAGARELHVVKTGEAPVAAPATR